ncbi:MAG: inositol monophosphatase family protein [Rickettsiales bacterium]|jgi:fructose-1,6-bisphosphatase/inositol monophosphatase family enzyme|nr:inositol monophosphatase family protein [Rickettsiales bacterium]
MTNEFTDIILHFIRKAGRLAKRQQKNLSASLKPDMSIVTQSDLSISKLFRREIEYYLNSRGHRILDEENLPETTEDLFEPGTEYLWTIDPIDGTNTYYHGFPLWAIAVGLYRNFKPYLGAIYMPSTGELLYNDDTSSYFVSGAFSKKEKIVNLSRSEKQVFTGRDIILHHRICNENFRKYSIIDLYSTYVIAFYTLAGKSIASFFGESSKLWDITATLPIAKNIGLCFRDVENDRDLESIDNRIINGDWSLNSRYLMCDPSIYESLKADNLFNS